MDPLDNPFDDGQFPNELPDHLPDHLSDEAADLHLQQLERSIADLHRTSKKALGFIHTVDYRGVPFNVSKRFVIADLAPLVFFHLVEHISIDVTSSIVRLYDRLGPLLTCRHGWLPLKRADDEQVRFIVGGTIATTARAATHRPPQTQNPPQNPPQNPARPNLPNPGPFICRYCTAYSLGLPLPVIGRDFAAPDPLNRDLP
jgi:hypothetical protein